jgi:hypothetical protein
VDYEKGRRGSQMAMLLLKRWCSLLIRYKN